MCIGGGLWGMTSKAFSVDNQCQRPSCLVHIAMLVWRYVLSDFRGQESLDSWLFDADVLSGVEDLFYVAGLPVVSPIILKQNFSYI